MDKRILKEAVLKHPELILQPFDALMGMEGFEAIYTLCENMGGATVYIPSARKIFARCIEREILREFDGYNHDRLARKYGYSGRHLKRIISSLV